MQTYNLNFKKPSILKKSYDNFFTLNIGCHPLPLIIINFFTRKYA
jgi:hypothetical protein